MKSKKYKFPLISYLLFYRFLLKNVQYKFEGRYRLLKNRFVIEVILSEMEVDDVLMVVRERKYFYIFYLKI